jgi:hypothetical protein
MKIAIIGGGWVGCHLAYKLKNEHTVTIFEKNHSLFEETSYKNQNRLHLGFHYARNNKTRKLCLDTFSRFLLDYEFLTKEIQNNLYCVPRNTSILDYETYIQIFRDFEYSEIENSLKNVEGCINTKERYIDFDVAKRFFNTQLSDLIIRKRITPNRLPSIKKEYDLVINATNNEIKDPNNYSSFFELTISLIYENIKKPEFDALTMVDGSLFSIYPYFENKFTVTDVEHTPIRKFKTISSLKKFKKNISESLIEDKKREIEKKINKYYPSFNKNFKYDSYFLSVKSKIISESDERYPVINKENNLINCFTGKIQGIYIIEDFIKKEITNYGR